MEKVKPKEVWELSGLSDQQDRIIAESYNKKQRILNEIAVILASYRKGETFKSKNRQDKKIYTVADIRARNAKLIGANDLFQHQELFIIYVLEFEVHGRKYPDRRMVNQKELKMKYY